VSAASPSAFLLVPPAILRAAAISDVLAERARWSDGFAPGRAGLSTPNENRRSRFVSLADSLPPRAAQLVPSTGKRERNDGEVGENEDSAGLADEGRPKSRDLDAVGVVGLVATRAAAMLARRELARRLGNW
jgi:hypothetical protein